MSSITDRTIRTPNGNEISSVRITPDMVFRKTTALYGASETGKTVIIKFIMSLLRHIIKEVLVICPTQPSNRAYDGWVDKTLIHYSITSKPAISMEDSDPPTAKKKETQLTLLNMIWRRQEMRSGIYASINKIKVLRRLYSYFPSKLGDSVIAHIENMFENITEMVKDKYKSNPGKILEVLKQVKLEKKDILREIYRKFIQPHRDADDYARLPNKLTDREEFTLYHFHFNPNLLLILEDCGAELKKYRENETIRKMFYQGRHNNMTILVSCQDDTDFPANLRKNVFVSFFTDPNVAIANYTRTTNNFPRHIQKYVQDVIPYIFKNKENTPEEEKYWVLAYIRKNQKLFCFKAPYPMKFKFGSTVLNALCNEVQEKSDAIDKNNPYYSMFNIRSGNSNPHFREKFGKDIEKGKKKVVRKRRTKWNSGEKEERGQS